MFTKLCDRQNVINCTISIGCMKFINISNGKTINEIMCTSPSSVDINRFHFSSYIPQTQFVTRFYYIVCLFKIYLLIDKIYVCFLVVDISCGHGHYSQNVITICWTRSRVYENVCISIDLVCYSHNSILTCFFVFVLYEVDEPQCNASQTF